MLGQPGQNPIDSVSGAGRIDAGKGLSSVISDAELKVLRAHPTIGKD